MLYITMAPLRPQRTGSSNRRGKEKHLPVNVLPMFYTHERHRLLVVCVSVFFSLAANASKVIGMCMRGACGG